MFEMQEPPSLHGIDSVHCGFASSLVLQMP